MKASGFVFFVALGCLSTPSGHLMAATGEPDAAQALVSLEDYEKTIKSIAGAKKALVLVDTSRANLVKRIEALRAASQAESTEKNESRIKLYETQLADFTQKRAVLAKSIATLEKKVEAMKTNPLLKDFIADQEQLNDVKKQLGEAVRADPKL